MKDTAEDTKAIQRKTPYDDVFRTMMEQCTQLIIPVINEVFHETYGMDEPIELRANEQLCKKANGECTKRVTDAYIIIKGSQYHIECQLNKDSNMAVRMLEYDFYIALTQIQKKNGRLTAEFPKSVVLQLRNRGAIPECYEISVKMQENTHAMYRVPVVKVQDYSRQELFDKQLLFFLPYYILRFENRMKEIDNSPEELQNLKEEYQEIMRHLVKLTGQKVINDQYMHKLVELTSRLVQVAARDAENIKREVITMGGQVLELTADKILAEGVEIGMKKGIEQGIEQGREQGIEIGIKKGYTKAYVNMIQTAMAEMHVPLEQACQLVPEEVRQQCRAIIEGEQSQREAGRTQNEPAVQRKPRKGR